MQLKIIAIYDAMSSHFEQLYNLLRVKKNLIKCDTHRENSATTFMIDDFPVFTGC